MALISIAADKGGGVTTSAVALAAVWPRQVLLAECDVAGGDLRYRLPGAGGKPLAQDPGVVSLASAVRGQASAELVLEHTQQVEGGLRVLVGPAQPEHAAAMASAWTPISGMLAGLPDMDVIADCGRVLGDSPLVPVLRRKGGTVQPMALTLFDDPYDGECPAESIHAVQMPETTDLVEGADALAKLRNPRVRTVVVKGYGETKTDEPWGIGEVRNGTQESNTFWTLTFRRVK